MMLKSVKIHSICRLKSEARRAAKFRAGRTIINKFNELSRPQEPPANSLFAGYTKALFYNELSRPDQPTVLQTACLSGGIAGLTCNL